MAETARITYKGDLRTEAVHLRSGNVLVTDAPPDNKGKGEYFSPTDLAATSLGCCIFTIMGISAREHGFSIDGATCSITKIMAEKPRRLGEIIIKFDFTGREYSTAQKRLLEYCVKTCPIALSLKESVIQNVTLHFR